MNFMPRCGELRWKFFGLLVLLLTAFSLLVPAQEPAEEPEIRAQLAAAERLLGRTADRGAVLYFLAATHAELQESSAAMENLKQCIALKEGFDPSGDPTFAGLKEDKDFQKLIEQVHKDFPPVSQAKLAFSTTEKNLLPEGLAFAPALDAFLLGSLHRKKIVKIPLQGKITDFVPGDRYDLLPILGIRIDPTDGSVWCNSWVDRGKTELLHFDPTGSLLGRYSLPEDGKHGFNDLVVLPDGDVLLTDSVAYKVFRFNSKTHEFRDLKLCRDLLMPNGIAMTGDGTLAYVADQLGVLQLHVKSGASFEVDPGPHTTLAGADGLYWHKGKLIAIQNGIGAPRIAVFQLSQSGLQITKATVLEYRSSFTVLPTTGALDGDDFYFIENSQLDNLNGDRILDVTKLEPVRIGKLRIP
jgi:sugar lactone lactonase YvrE